MLRNKTDFVIAKNVNPVFNMFANLVRNDFFTFSTSDSEYPIRTYPPHANVRIPLI